MTALTEYAVRLTQAITDLARDEAAAIERAAAVVADQFRRGGQVYLYGPGAHSAIAVQDVVYRAGCPANLVPITDPSTTLAAGALNSTAAERTPNHGADLITASGLSPGDPLIIINAFGINAATITAARTAHSLGATVIALTSPAATAHLPATHPARATTTHLADLADIHINTHVPTADALLQVGPTPTAGASTILNSFTLHALLTTALTHLHTTNHQTPVWRSTYTEGGDAHNQSLVASRPST
ncbi:sugar isomerase domain-containing protein [Kribbella sandramycini]|uniref:Putative phosphosugar-binding protein n=1 Tax=Kribbella sandramycini TaxID=60450 RepID=A0A7Y4P2U7_9ACTN|nr:sugar isomerase domain-containing protein [Kribbella sandramycini]MBB6571147.1 putative phosphosugar-binding protein [Kribbella sandramycini]NOL43445.1 sugar isomerase domain-containing protein [Kribbella sandramycini]